MLESIWPTVLSFLQQMGVICCLAVSYKNKKEIYTFLFLQLTLLVLYAEIKLEKAGFVFFLLFFLLEISNMFSVKMLNWKGKAEEPPTCCTPSKNLSLTIFHKWSVSAHSCESFSALFILHPWNITLVLT